MHVARAYLRTREYTSPNNAGKIWSISLIYLTDSLKIIPLYGRFAYYLYVLSTSHWFVAFPSICDSRKYEVINNYNLGFRVYKKIGVC